jgi:hypothetical protein
MYRIAGPPANIKSLSTASIDGPPAAVDTISRQPTTTKYSYIKQTVYVAHGTMQDMPIRDDWLYPSEVCRQIVGECPDSSSVYSSDPSRYWLLPKSFQKTCATI